MMNPNRSGRRGALALSAGLLAAMCAAAAPTPAPIAAPAAAEAQPCVGSAAPFRDLDFLVGGWQQRWTSLRFHIECAGRGDVDGSYVIEGRMKPVAGGESLPFRGVWTRLADGSVRQELLRFDVATGAWNAFFVAVSRRLLH